MAKKFTDLALDLETLAVKFDAAIMSVGAQAFNRNDGKLGPTFYHEIDWRRAVQSGSVNGDTVAWWIRQGESAQRLFDHSPEALQRKLPLATAMHALNNFCTAELVGDFNPWGYGATMDITIAEHAYDVGCIGLSPPWLPKRPRDGRTIIELAEELAGFKLASVPRVGTHHNARDDATWLAHAIIMARQAIKLAIIRPTPVVDDDDEL